MVATIDLTSASSNMKAYLASWENGFTSNYGAFWNATDGIVTAPASTDTFDQWGAGSTGGNGIVLDGDDLQYSQGNLTGEVDTITLGNSYSQSASGISVSSELTITNDPLFDTSGAGDALDFAIYGLSVQGTTSYLYDYLADVGTVINDTSGSDVLIGFGGEDTFVFSGGNDTVTSDGTGTYGYQDGTDTLDVSAWGATQLSDLSLYQDGSDAYIYMGSNSVTLEGANTSDLDASDFLFA
ncbi:hypothetical protein [Roseibium algae]|uniref:Hemolysin type calcium-binding protein n=1 Tax=Roseibium algae TaxID=3123038 RepID=A0ABU8TEH2_9HYPH